MARKHKAIVIVIIIVTLLHFCFVLNGNELNNWLPQKSDEITYSSVSDESPIVYDVQDDVSTPITDLQPLLNYEIEGLIYFGRDTCPVCRHFNQLLNKLKNNNNDIVIYKFDTDVWREDASFQAVLNLYRIVDVPVIIYVSDGEFVPFEPNQITDIDTLESDFSQFLKKISYA